MSHFSILVLLAIPLMAYDIWLTRRRMHDYGTKVEMNYVVRRLAQKLGIEAGLLLGVFLPFCALTMICRWLNWEDFYAGYVGFRSFLFYIQLKSLLVERAFKAASLNKQ